MNNHLGSLGARGRCRSCKAPIIWVKTEKGLRMPVDPEPVSNGNLLLRQRLYHIPLALYISKANKPSPEEKRYVSHFATCPEAEKHRRVRH